MERGGKALGVAERVGDALRRDEVLVVAGIADQCPAGAKRLPEIVRHGSPDEPFFASGGGHPLHERRRQRARTQIVTLDVRLVGLELSDRPADDDESQIIIGGPQRERPSASVVRLEMSIHR